MELDLQALRQVFVVEANEQLDQLDQGLVDLEARPTDRELARALFRLVHTLKGNAMSVRAAGVSELAHAMEDVIERMSPGEERAFASAVSALFRAVDGARRMLPSVAAGADEKDPEQQEILRVLAASVRAAPGERATTPDATTEQGAPAPRAEAARTVRVDVGKLDRMVDLIGEIAVGRSRLRQQIAALGGGARGALLESDEALDRLFGALEDLIRTSRMVPVGPQLRTYARTVRDAGKAAGKLVRLAIEGGDVEVDTAVIERLRDPLTHLVRNAVDHGIEPPDVRRERGKPPCGTVTMRVTHHADSIVLSLSDDGGGMDRARVLARARAMGRAAADLSDGDLHELLFEPGFTTAAAVTDLSGRGVGLDAVRRSIEAMRGTVRVESAEGLGMRFTIRLPLTLATIEGFCVTAAGESYVLPLASVVECLALPAGELRGESGGILNLRGETLPCVRLRELFAGGRAPVAEEKVVVVSFGGGRAGLVVDDLHGASRTVITPLARLFRGVPAVSGSTILGDGRVALILDVEALFTEAVRRRR